MKPASTNVVIVCACVFLCLVVSGVVMLQYAGRDASQALYLLSGFLAPTLPAIFAFIRGEGTKKTAEETSKTVKEVKEQTNGHSEAIGETQTKVNSLEEDVHDLKVKTGIIPAGPAVLNIVNPEKDTN